MNARVACYKTRNGNGNGKKRKETARVRQLISEHLTYLAKECVAMPHKRCVALILQMHVAMYSYIAKQNFSL